jgi:hypothetical protein
MRRLRQALGPLRANMYSKAFEVVVHTSPFSFLLPPTISYLFSRKPGMTPITVLGGSHQPITSASVRNYRIGLAAESRHTKHRHVTCDLEVRHNRAQLPRCQSNSRLEGQTVLFASPSDLCSYWGTFALGDTMATRKAHSKSRLGCHQCKKRRIKVRGILSFLQAFERTTGMASHLPRFIAFQRAEHGETVRDSLGANHA